MSSGHFWLSVVLISLFGSVAAPGCGKSDTSTATAASAAAGGSGGARAGYVTGRVTAENGKPISVKGAKVSIAIAGVGSKSGERLEYFPRVNPDGTYEQKLVDGAYR